MKGLSGTQSVGLIFIWLAILLNHKVEGKIGCKDMSGNDVDWWVVLKGPVEPGSDDTNALDGVAYSYTDAANPLFETKFGFFFYLFLEQFFIFIVNFFFFFLILFFSFFLKRD